MDFAQWNNDLYNTSEAQMVATFDPETIRVCKNCYKPLVKHNKLAVAATYQAKCKCFSYRFPYHSWDHCSACETL